MVNDRVDVAVAAGVVGVQLAYHSLGPKWVKQALPQSGGAIVHSEEEAKEMEMQKADFLIYGHIYTSGSKPGLQARGIGALSKIVQAVKIPVIAIGGIHPRECQLLCKPVWRALLSCQGFWMQKIQSPQQRNM